LNEIYVYAAGAHVHLSTDLWSQWAGQCHCLG